jgi:hypothetical protein
VRGAQHWATVSVSAQWDHFLSRAFDQTIKITDSPACASSPSPPPSPSLVHHTSLFIAHKNREGWAMACGAGKGIWGGGGAKRRCTHHCTPLGIPTTVPPKASACE